LLLIVTTVAPIIRLPTTGGASRIDACRLSNSDA